MLGRTANGLFWMFRYIERAENTARLIDAGLRMSLTRMHGHEEEWESVLRSSGVFNSYSATNAKVTGADAVNYLLRDTSNPSSILSAIEAARNNGRMVRTALTREAWEATNECYLDIKAQLARKISGDEMPEIINTIKQRTGLIRGAFHGTMLRNEIYNFSRIGTFIERADNTSRILDVKYYVLLPAVSYVGSSLDNVQWESILRSVSAHRSYGWVYDDDYKPANIADFLILNGRMPRSLAYCYDKITANLGYLEREYGERTTCHETAAATLGMLREREIQSIMDFGLHEFLQDFISHNSRVAAEISEAYRFYQD
ncbi:MAG: alpha-E domain-containing protein [Hoeflea sp.]|uniref:alpha-E domain-containing protein n=1 Tax=Hoeflea sp. TaxID=1940281 RepID=UPI00272F3C6E|nr:alpha-E domain-containing protein [Hoeflea sp.]MDP2119831.1 alpha-E domain-containing protein [Hoeflea sp.]MDP3525626.1 alpha-E domain-containing protein [Hoeflea sp.]MDZ7600049.1 alpha-E domain-containing protein [Hoeflea sp.]